MEFEFTAPLWLWKGEGGWHFEPACRWRPGTGNRRLADGACDAVFDVGHRTAAHRLLADVARSDPAIFRAVDA